MRDVDRAPFRSRCKPLSIPRRAIRLKDNKAGFKIETLRRNDRWKQLAVQERAWSEAIRFERYCLLNEIPGLVFGLLAIIYVVTSLAALA